VYAEDLRGNNSSNGKAVKDVYESLPCFNVTSSLALVVKAIDCGNGQKYIRFRHKLLTSCDIRTLVVPSQEEEILGVLDLVAKQEKDGL